VTAPKRVHDALDKLWEARRLLHALKTEQPRDIDKISEAARKVRIASDEFELRLNG
jgi:hypothetical protein